MPMQGDKPVQCSLTRRFATTNVALASLVAILFQSSLPVESGGACRPTLDEPTWETKAEYRLKIAGTFLPEGGLRISQVEPDGPGEKLRNSDGSPGKLESGDILLSIDGNSIKSLADCQQSLQRSAQNQGNVTIQVRDVRTGQVFQWQTTAEITNVPFLQGRIRPVGLTFQAFRGRIQNLIRNGKIPMKEPVFDWNAGDFMVYKLPSTLPTACMGSGDRMQEYTIPLSYQVTVETIRHFRTRVSPQAQAFWGRVLPKVETLIEAMFVRIRDSKPGEEDSLSRFLFELERQISKTYTEELNTLAIQNGKKGAKTPPVPCEASIAKCQIIPVNGVCKYMSSGSWLVERVLNDRDPSWDFPGWTRAPNPGRLETANFTRVWVKWPDGREWADTIQIPSNARILTLRPTGWSSE
jgi:hypothetical protein